MGLGSCQAFNWEDSMLFAQLCQSLVASLGSHFPCTAGYQKEEPEWEGVHAVCIP